MHELIWCAKFDGDNLRGITMECGERARLEKSHNDAEEAFDAARKIVGEKIGVTTREEFVALTRAVDATWHALKSARFALDEHIRTHGYRDGNVQK